jgi:hypothetical protein
MDTKEGKSNARRKTRTEPVSLVIFSAFMGPIDPVSLNPIWYLIIIVCAVFPEPILTPSPHHKAPWHLHDRTSLLGHSEHQHPHASGLELNRQLGAKSKMALPPRR